MRILISYLFTFFGYTFLFISLIGIFTPGELMVKIIALGIVILLGILCIAYGKQIKNSKQAFSKKHVKNQDNPPKTTQHEQPLESYVAGSNYHQKECKRLFNDLDENNYIQENDDFSLSKKEIVEEFIYADKIWKYKPCQIPFLNLEPEPTNEFDKNAIKVNLSADNENFYFVGYVPKKHLELWNLAISNPSSMSIHIQGGIYKELTSDDEGEDKIIKGVTDFSFKVLIDSSNENQI